MILFYIAMLIIPTTCSYAGAVATIDWLAEPIHYKKKNDKNWYKKDQNKYIYFFHIAMRVLLQPLISSLNQYTNKEMLLSIKIDSLNQLINKEKLYLVYIFLLSKWK